jgi:hypothetical protein
VRGKEKYPDDFMELLTQAAGMYAQLHGQQEVYSNKIVELLIKAIEKDSLGSVEVKFMDDGKPRYLEYAYPTAVKTRRKHSKEEVACPRVEQGRSPSCDQECCKNCSKERPSSTSF